jgi:hypothetical protein
MAAADCIKGHTGFEQFAWIAEIDFVDGAVGLASAIDQAAPSDGALPLEILCRWSGDVWHRSRPASGDPDQKDDFSMFVVDLSTSAEVPDFLSQLRAKARVTASGSWAMTRSNVRAGRRPKSRNAPQMSPGKARAVHPSRLGSF